MSALQSNVTGSNNTAIGYMADTSIDGLSNATAIGANARVYDSNTIQLGDNAVTNLYCGVSLISTSDRRLKSNIVDSDLGLNFIKTLRPVSYFRNNDASKKTEYGFIAQELEESLNKAGAVNNGIIHTDNKGMYSVRYNDLFSPIVKAMQEQQTVIENQESTIEKLEKQSQSQDEVIKNLIERLTKLEAKQ
jgi:hypothetical protein